MLDLARASPVRRLHIVEELPRASCAAAGPAADAVAVVALQLQVAALAHKVAGGRLVRGAFALIPVELGDALAAHALDVGGGEIKGGGDDS